MFFSFPVSVLCPNLSVKEFIHTVYKCIQPNIIINSDSPGKQNRPLMANNLTHFIPPLRLSKTEQRNYWEQTDSTVAMLNNHTYTHAHTYTQFEGWWRRKQIGCALASLHALYLIRHVSLLCVITSDFCSKWYLFVPQGETTIFRIKAGIKSSLLGSGESSLKTGGSNAEYKVDNVSCYYLMCLYYFFIYLFNILICRS